MKHSAPSSKYGPSSVRYIYQQLWGMLISANRYRLLALVACEPIFKSKWRIPSSVPVSMALFSALQKKMLIFQWGLWRDKIENAWGNDRFGRQRLSLLRDYSKTLWCLGFDLFYLSEWWGETRIYTVTSWAMFGHDWWSTALFRTQLCRKIPGLPAQINISYDSCVNDNCLFVFYHVALHGVKVQIYSKWFVGSNPLLHIDTFYLQRNAYPSL